MKNVQVASTCRVYNDWVVSVPGSCHNMKMTLLKKIKKVVKFLMKLKVVHFFFFFGVNSLTPM